MACCCFFCLPVTGATTDEPLPIARMSSPFVNYCLLKPNLRFSRLRLLFPRKMRFKDVVCAEITNAFSSPNARFNFQSNVHSYNTSQFPWIGPVPGDMAEIEAYCRIFRGAEALHAALMNTLCNPFTGVCSIPYNFPVKEKPILEDKIVSLLGCLLSLLNKGREDVLSGRSSVMNIFQDTDLAAIEDKLPPLFIFRSEMKQCCDNLHVALENFLTLERDQDLDTWRKLQRLKNVCYDFGFPREDHCPCHQLFANWSPVYLSDSNDEITLKDPEVAFYMGGQVTEEGLNWLIEKGYRTIIDLTEENIRDSFCQVALDATVSSGKIELVKIPVEVGTAPTMGQVKEFASLVLDCRKKPIYLHSKEGVWRTASMVSRWRQHMSQCVARSVSSQLVSTEDAAVLPMTALGNSHTSFMDEEKLAFNEQNNSSQKNINIIHNLNGASAATVCLHGNHGSGGISGNTNSNFTSQSLSAAETSASGVNLQRNSSIDIDPLMAQIPPSDVFSKTEMSKFLKRKNISPTVYFRHTQKQIEMSLVSRDASVVEIQRNETTGKSCQLRLAYKGSSRPKRGPGTADSSSPTSRREGSGISSLHCNGNVNASDDSDKNITSQIVLKDQKNKRESLLLVDSNVSELVEGDMRSSMTGIVRLQSRKKAEMFLVRTDGFSCTREKVNESSLAFTHPNTQQQMLLWKSTPRTVLLLKKLGPALMEEAKEVASFLYHQERMNVLVEPDVHDIFARIPGFGFVQTFYNQDTSNLHERVDFIVCLGGDGVILHASNLFRGAVPPAVSFNLGSLGFLTSHKFEDYKQDLRQVIHGNGAADGVYITLRMRLHCEIFRNGKAMPGKVVDVLNEVIVDRGSNPYLSKIECYEHDHLITKVQGDGVIVATPTGSTAYSTAAGGSMVHPSVPCMLFTPICPHSLSFRPVILPDSARLELKIPKDARSNAWVSFDGKRRQQLSQGDAVRISMSHHPLPTVNKSDQTCDWFRSLIRCLNWNERREQKAL